MHWSSFHFLPPLFVLLAIVLGAMIFILQIGILGYAYEKMGISRGAALAILVLSLAGSGVNIPLAEMPGGRVVEVEETVRWGVRYRRPVVVQWPDTTLAINLGGALIPTALSLYLIAKNEIYAQALVGVSIVTVVVFLLAEPIDRMGIAVPIFVPPIVSAVVAMLLTREHAAPLAYASGCLGTLIGADVLNLGSLSRLGASVASIGGAGTFDAVFLTGVLAVLLAISPRPTAPPRPALQSRDDRDDFAVP